MTQSLHMVPADSVRATLDRVFTASEFAWRPLRNPFQFLLDLLARLQRWLGRLEDVHPVAYYALLVGLTIALVGILSHLGYLVWRALRPVELPAGAAAAPRREVRDAAWYLHEAERLASEGRYTDALVHRFLALVQELGARRALTIHPSKTPAEYAREARLDEPGRRALSDLVGVLYRHVFGGAPCGSAELAWFGARAEEVTERLATG